MQRDECGARKERLIAVRAHNQPSNCRQSKERVSGGGGKEQVLLMEEASLPCGRSKREGRCELDRARGYYSN